MKTLRQEAIELVYVEEYLPTELEQGKFYVSKQYNGSSHLCLCGCGTQCYLPIKEGEWILKDDNGKVTLKPSILQRFDCKSHYIITNGIANFV